MATQHSRRLAGAISSLLIALVAVTGLAGTAHAEDGYQYWNYWHLQKNAWVFSKVGAADYKPKDGAVEGFRYGISTGSKGLEPRADLKKVNFDTICGGTDLPAGQKRVAVVLDYGVELGSGKPPEPRGECAVVAKDASTQQVLQKVVDVRVGSGMVCALDGYPPSGCGEPVKNATMPAHEATVAFALPHDKSGQSGTSKPASASQSSGAPWTLVGLGALVVVIAGGAVAISRRSKTA